jgi:hypothetical protein
MPSKRRFRDDGTKATRLYKADDGDDQMYEKDEDVVHARHRIKISKNPGIQVNFGIRHPHRPYNLPAKFQVPIIAP